MTDTFRALFKEMVDWIDQETYTSRGEDPLVTRARAALDQPEPVAPTDEELLELAEDAWIPFAKSQPHPQGHSWDLVLARAVLARWGRPAIEPVPKREDVHYAWELHDAEGEWQAGGSANSLKDVQREGNRYLQTYSQDSPHKLIIEQHRVTTIEPVPGVEGADA
jgi:hypothetical protein